VISPNQWVQDTTGHDSFLRPKAQRWTTAELGRSATGGGVVIATSYFRSSGRQTALAAVCLLALSVTGCGSVNFLGHFPTGRRLSCATEGHPIRAVQFTFNPGGDRDTGNRANSGQVTITFGDAVDSFDVSGAFICSDMQHSTTPSGTITVTFAPGEATLGQYRELAGRVKAARERTPGPSTPDELPPQVRFTAQFTNGPSPLILTSNQFGKGEFPRDPPAPAKKE
jgi:hypothetical protein